MKKTVYYTSEQEDIVKAKDQNLKLDPSYRWIHTSSFYNLSSQTLYRIFKVWAYFFIKFGLSTTILNKEILPKGNQGYFLYLNHTQEFGDPFLPSQIVEPKRSYIVASPSNLSIPILGKLLPMLGALPIPDTLEQMRRFKAAIAQRIQENESVVIFPEAHVWPYYTKIRAFPDTSFQFPIDAQVSSYVAVVTYQKGKRKKPKRVVYIDGPFDPDDSLNRRAKRKKLAEEIYHAMERLAEHSDYEYIHYEKREEPK